MFIKLIMTLLIGTLSGYIANRIMNNDADNMLANMGLGIIGSFVGTILLALIGFGSINIFGNIIVSVFGACVAIWLYRRFSR